MDNDGYFSDIAFFKKYNEYVDSYQNSNPKIYFFLKDCGFQRFYHENKNCFPDDETKNMCNKFQLEMMKYQYNKSMVSKNIYAEFIEDIFIKTNFKKLDLDLCFILKALTENLGVFGSFDDLTAKRIVYFNNKIKKLISGKSDKISSKNIEANNKSNTPVNYFSSNNNNSIFYENIVAINFISSDQLINFPIGGVKSDKFSIIEEKLLNEFPELKNKDIYYIANGNVINKELTLEQNKIKTGNSILIQYNQ